MSRKTVLTIRVEVELTLPPGANADVGLTYIQEALVFYKGGLPPEKPIAGLNGNLIRTKLIERKTTYL